MTSELPLRPVVIAVATAVGCFVAANVAIYFLLFRPVPAAPAAAPQSEPAAVQAPAAPTNAPVAAPGDNLLAAPDRWLPVTGEWTLDGTTARQAQTDANDLMLLYNQPAPQPQLTVRLRHDQGVGGGVVFNAPASGAKPGTHLVRFLDAQTLIWGYFDDNGTFVGQGTAAIADPGTAAHTLAVSVGPDTYAITLDGTQLAQGVPVVGRGEYAGLAASQSSVVFEAASLAGATAPPAAEAAPAPDAAPQAVPPAAAPQLQPGAGDWVQEGGAILQRSDQAADLFAAYGTTGDRYTLSVDVLLPANAPDDTGGGLLFAMPDPAGLAGAQMVRFNRNGQELFWGVFNDQGAFQGQGGAALTLDLAVPHNLKVVVNGNTYALWVDGQQVAADRPLGRAAGGVGLITYRGPITFTNYSLAANAGS